METKKVKPEDVANLIVEGETSLTISVGSRDFDLTDNHAIAIRLAMNITDFWNTKKSATNPNPQWTDEDLQRIEAHKQATLDYVKTGKKP